MFLEIYRILEFFLSCSEVGADDLRAYFDSRAVSSVRRVVNFNFSITTFILHFLFLDDAVHVVICKNSESGCNLPMGRFLSSAASSRSL